MIRYCRDEHGAVVVPHVGGKTQVIATLSYPAEVCDQPEGASDADLVAMLSGKGEEEVEDDPEGSLKATRIDAKKREIAIDLTAREQKLVRRAAVNKELAEGYLLNRAHRLEVRDQSEAMFRVQNQTLAMSERNLVLIEKIQEGLGRVAELEKEASRRAATPPPPIDYSPVLNSVVGAIRDIGVSALQRDHKLRPKTDDDAPPVKANLADKPAAPAQAGSISPASTPAPAIGAPTTVPALPAAGQPSVAELLAEAERLRAERNRFEEELAAERKRQLVLAELSGAPAPTVASPMEQPSVASHTAPATMPTATQPAHKVSRNAPCPCGSGRKYKKCCLGKELSPIITRAADGGSRPSKPASSTEYATGGLVAQPEQRSSVAQAPVASDPLSTTKVDAPSVEPVPRQTAEQTQSTPAAATPASPDTPVANVSTTASAPPEAGALKPAVQETQTPPTDSIPTLAGEHLQELLVNAMAGKMLADPDAPIPPPLVSQVALLEEVIVAPPKMDHETARRLLKDGTALEAFGAFLFFNPAIRTMLLSRRGK